MKASRKFVSALLVMAMLFTLLFTGCAPKAADAEAAPAEAVKPAEEKILIGVAMQGFKGIFCQYIVAGINDYLETNGLTDKYTVKIVVSEDKVDKQVSQVEAFIAEGAKAIILNPVDRVGSAPAVEAAKKAGIPLLTVNTSTENQADAMAYVGSNDVEAGKIQMEYLIKSINEKGNIAVIHGAMGHSAQVGRWQGYTETVAKYPNVKIVVDQTAEWATDKAQSLMENWIQSGKQIDAVACNCDTEAVGAQNAVDAAGMTGKILVGGMDAIPDVMKSIKDGVIACTIWQDGIGQGANAMRLAIDAAEGKAISDFIIPYELINKDNVADYEKKAADRDALNEKYN